MSRLPSRLADLIAVERYYELHSPSTAIDYTARTADVEEVLVIGRRPPSWPTDNLPIGSIAFEDGYYGIYKTLPDGKPNPEYTAAEVMNPHHIAVTAQNGESAGAIAAKLAKGIAKVETGMAALTGLENIQTTAGVVRAEELKLLWQDVNFKFVDQIPNAPVTAPAALDWVDGKPVVIFSAAAAAHADEAVYPDSKGVTYLIMHEIGHMTRVGNEAKNQALLDYAFNNPQDPNFEHFNDHPPNPYRIHSEHTADIVGIAVANYVGMPIDATLAPWGY